MEMCIKISKPKVKMYTVILVFVLTALWFVIININIKASADTSNAIVMNKLPKVSCTCDLKYYKP